MVLSVLYTVYTVYTVVNCVYVRVVRGCFPLSRRPISVTHVSLYISVCFDRIHRIHIMEALIYKGSTLYTVWVFRRIHRIQI